MSSTWQRKPEIMKTWDFSINVTICRCGIWGCGSRSVTFCRCGIWGCDNISVTFCRCGIWGCDSISVKFCRCGLWSCDNISVTFCRCGIWGCDSISVTLCRCGIGGCDNISVTFCRRGIWGSDSDIAAKLGLLVRYALKPQIRSNIAVGASNIASCRWRHHVPSKHRYWLVYTVWLTRSFKSSPIYIFGECARRFRRWYTADGQTWPLLKVFIFTLYWTTSL